MMRLPAINCINDHCVARPAAGITPMFQLLKASLLDRDDRTSFSLLFANNTPDDVLLRRELDDLAKEHPSRFKVGNASKGIAV